MKNIITNASRYYIILTIFRHNNLTFLCPYLTASY